MAYISKNARWFIGDFVESIRIEDKSELLIHINTLLIGAQSADEAYEKALFLGEQMNSEFVNTDGKAVVCKFEGLCELNVIHDELEHGAELCFQAISGADSKRIMELITPKNELSIFGDSAAPAENYYPASVADEVSKRLSASE